jgi:hypothetical protein
MNIQNILRGGLDQFIALLTRELNPNEAAAVGQIVAGVVALVEAAAINRGPTLPAAGNFPAPKSAAAPPAAAD